MTNLKANSAKTGEPMPTPRPRHIVVVAFDRAQLLDVAGPLQAFATAGELDGFIALQLPIPHRCVLPRWGGDHVLWTAVHRRAVRSGALAH